MTAVTLGAQGLPPSDYASWIDHYAALRPDVICIVADPSGHPLVHTQFLPARRSALFRAFGYSAILPLVLEEKGERLHSAPVRLAGDGSSRWRTGSCAVAETADRTAVDGPLYLAALEAAIRAAVRTALAGVVVVTVAGCRADFVRQTGCEGSGTPRPLPTLRFAWLISATIPRCGARALRLNAFDFSAAGHAAAANDIAPAVVELLRLEATSMTGKTPKNPERSFGISVGPVLCAIAALLLVARPRRAGRDRRRRSAPFLLSAGLTLSAAAEVSERGVVAVRAGARATSTPASC